MAETPAEFTPIGGKRSSFREALARYAIGLGGHKGMSAAGSVKDLGADYLSADNQTDMSDADKSYLTSMGGDISGLIDQYRGENPVIAQQREAAKRKSASDRFWADMNAGNNWGSSEKDYYDDPNYVSRSMGTVKTEKTWHDPFTNNVTINKPGYFTIPKAVTGQVGGFADSLKKNWNNAF